MSYDVSDGTDTTPNTATLVVTGADEPNTAPVAVDDVLGDDSDPVSEFLVNELTNDAQNLASQHHGAGGRRLCRHVAVLTHNRAIPTYAGVKARIFNADGTEAVSEFLVNELHE